MQRAVQRLPFRLLSPRGDAARLTILVFHRVPRQPDPLLPDEPDAERFDREMRWVREWFDVLPLADAVDRLGKGTLEARALAITFDDGYADNAEVAAPILQRLGLTATFFIATGFMDGTMMWNDLVIEAFRHCTQDELDLRALGAGVLKTATLDERRSSLMALLKEIKHRPPTERTAAVDAIVAAIQAPPAASLMMTPAQVRRLRELGMDVGAHTVSHPILARLDSAQARAEIGASREHLEGLLKERVRVFAYPNGLPQHDYTQEHVRIARECGFDAAVSTAWGTASRRSDRFQLPRFTPWDRSRARYGLRLLMNLRQDGAVAG